MKFIFGIVSLAVLLFVTATAQAQGILLVKKETRGGATTSNQMQIDKNYMRAESSGDHAAVIFDGPKQTMRRLDLEAKTYQEITKADLTQMKQQMDAAMAQIQSLPPAQRQLMEQMMGGRGMPGMPAAAPPKPEFRAAGSDKVGQWACTKYEGFIGQQKTVEVCATDPKNLNLTAADFAIADQLMEFMKSIAPDSMERMVVNGTVKDQGYAGIELRRTTFRNGAVESVTEISEVRRETFPASTFEVPAGFKKDAAPGARGLR